MQAVGPAVGAAPAANAARRTPRRQGPGEGTASYEKSYKLEADCANCANKMEAAAKKTPGVRDAVVNFMALKMSVEFEDGADPKAVMQDVPKACKRLEDGCGINL